MNASALQMDSQTALMANQQAPRIGRNLDPIQARKVAEDFEAFFLAQSFQTMFQGIKTEAPFGGGHAEEMYRGLQAQEYGKEVAKNGGIGIADAVFREIIRLQEAQ